jgi:hypothetical protein
MPTEAHPTSELAGTPISAMRLREGGHPAIVVVVCRA